VRHDRHGYDDLFTNILPILWRRRRLIYLAILLAAGVAFLVHSTVGERYEAYTLLRVGQGIKDRSAGTVSGPFGEGIDLVSRIDSLARLATTDHVIRAAATEVGFDRLFPRNETSWLATLRSSSTTWLTELLPAEYHFLLGYFVPAQAQQLDSKKGQEALEALRTNISARQEGRSDLFRISFRFHDPAIAMEYVNALANALVAIQAELIQVPGADTFFQQQARRMEHESELAAAELQNFSVSASIYSVADQRGLLLKRANELSTQIATTRGSIEERRGQKQAIVDQLLILRPVTQSKTVTGIVNSLGSRDYKPGSNAAGTLGGFEEAPPLLLVRVYQDAVATLMKTNSELNGLIKLEKLQGLELEQVNTELAALSSKESEYDRLKRVLTRASAAADHYGSRVIEEQINLDIAKRSQLSSVRVVQAADKPLAPVFPRAVHLIMLALMGGLALGSATILLPEFARVRRENDREVEFERAVVELGLRSVRSGRQVEAAE
jgi:polysaccharide biosynthesis transport protein